MVIPERWTSAINVVILHLRSYAALPVQKPPYHYLHLARETPTVTVDLAGELAFLCESGQRRFNAGEDPSRVPALEGLGRT